VPQHRLSGAVKQKRMQRLGGHRGRMVAAEEEADADDAEATAVDATGAGAVAAGGRLKCERVARDAATATAVTKGAPPLSTVPAPPESFGSHVRTRVTPCSILHSAGVEFTFTAFTLAPNSSYKPGLAMALAMRLSTERNDSVRFRRVDPLNTSAFEDKFRSLKTTSTEVCKFTGILSVALRYK
jgi:hypothetical protein